MALGHGSLDHDTELVHIAGGLHFCIPSIFVDAGEDGTDQCQLDKPTPLWARPMTVVEGRCRAP